MLNQRLPFPGALWARIVSTSRWHYTGANCTDLYELRKLLRLKQFLGSTIRDHAFNTHCDYTGERTLHRAHLQATKASYPTKGKLEDVFPALDRDLLTWRQTGEANIKAYHEAYTRSEFKHPTTKQFHCIRTFVLKADRLSAEAWERATKPVLEAELKRLRTALQQAEVDHSTVLHSAWKTGTPPETPEFYNIKGAKYCKSYLTFNREAWAREIRELTILLGEQQQVDLEAAPDDDHDDADASANIVS